MAVTITSGVAKRATQIPLRGRGEPGHRKAGDPSLNTREKQLARLVELAWGTLPPSVVDDLFKDPDGRAGLKVAVHLEQFKPEFEKVLMAQVDETATQVYETIRDEVVAARFPTFRKAEGDAKPIPTKTEGWYRFDRASPTATGYAKTESAAMVSNMTKDQIASTRSIVHRSFTEQRTRRATSTSLFALLDEMPPAGGVSTFGTMFAAPTRGLTSRGSNAVFQRGVDLAAAGKSVAQVNDGLEKYGTKLRRARAKTISRTEIMRASNAGRMEGMNQALSKGLITNNARKQWQTSRYDVCPICVGVSGEIRPIKEPFSVGGDHPPAHPNCRCTVRLLPDPTVYGEPEVLTSTGPTSGSQIYDPKFPDAKIQGLIDEATDSGGPLGLDEVEDLASAKQVDAFNEATDAGLSHTDAEVYAQKVHDDVISGAADHPPELIFESHQTMLDAAEQAFDDAQAAGLAQGKTLTEATDLGHDAYGAVDELALILDDIIDVVPSPPKVEALTGFDQHMENLASDLGALSPEQLEDVTDWAYDTALDAAQKEGKTLAEAKALGVKAADDVMEAHHKLGQGAEVLDPAKAKNPKVPDFDGVPGDEFKHMTEKDMEAWYKNEPPDGTTQDVLDDWQGHQIDDINEFHSPATKDTPEFGEWLSPDDVGAPPPAAPAPQVVTPKPKTLEQLAGDAQTKAYADAITSGGTKLQATEAGSKAYQGVLNKAPKSPKPTPKPKPKPKQATPDKPAMSETPRAEGRPAPDGWTLDAGEDLPFTKAIEDEAAGKGLSGQHAKRVFTDPDTGDQFIFKPQDRWQAELDVATSNLQSELGLSGAKSHVVTIDGQVGSLQAVVGGNFNGSLSSYGGKAFDATRLGAKQMEQMQKNRMFDFLISNHDAHDENFMRLRSAVDSDMLPIGIDKGQAFKYFERSDEAGSFADWMFNPNNNVASKNPYSEIMRQVAEGKETAFKWMDESKELTEFVQKAAAMADNGDVDRMFRAYAEEAFSAGRLPAKSPDAFIKALEDRWRGLADSVQAMEDLLEATAAGAGRRAAATAAQALQDLNLAAAATFKRTTNAQMDRDFKARTKNLPSTQQDAVRHYTAGGFTPMNGALRSAKGVDYRGAVDATTMKSIKNLEAAMAEIGTDSVVHRGSGSIYDLGGRKIDIGSVEAGTVFADHGFMSTSAGKKADFSGGMTLLEIHVPAEVKGLWVKPISSFASTESEFILERGLTMVVTEVQQAGNAGRVARLVVQVVPRATAEDVGLAVARNVMKQSGEPAWLMMT